MQTGPEVTDGSILFFDDFSDGNADGWTTTSGIWSVGGEEYSGQAGSGKIGARVYANIKAIFDDITVTP